MELLCFMTGKMYENIITVHCLFFQVVIGGGTTGVEMLSLDTLTWTTLDPLPVSSLQDYSCELILESGEETIYVTGGYSDDEGFQSKVWKMSRGTWSLAGELNEARAYHSMGILDGQLVVAGGWGSDRKLATVERRDEEGNWKTLPRSLSVVRANHATAAVPAEAFPCIK